MRTRRLAAAGLGMMLAACAPGGDHGAPPDPAPPPATITVTTAGAASVDGDRARSQLGGLAVKGRAPKTGYSRGQFGPAWADVDRNGCDTRNDILNRDLTARTWRPATRGCVVVGGSLADPYTGRIVSFVKARAGDIQIDHVVSLSDAWQTGAFAWDPKVRLAFANDPMNLLAVEGRVNQAKADSDAASWLPPDKLRRCAFVARQIDVKAAYGLWVTPAEHDAMGRVLASCR